MTSDELFALFWKAYPRKQAVGAARKAWKAIPEKELDNVIKGLERATLHCEQWRKDGGAFIPHASTWLHQRRWEDEYKIELPTQPQRAAQIDQCDIPGCTTYAVFQDLRGRNKRCREHIHTQLGSFASRNH